MHKLVSIDKICPVADKKLEYMVIGARYRNKWLLVRLKGQKSWCFPGGHREDGETMDEAAHRELFEESGAQDYSLKSCGYYSVDDGERISWGSIYTCEVYTLGALPEGYEIEEIMTSENFTMNNARFPLLMPALMDYFKKLT